MDRVPVRVDVSEQLERYAGTLFDRVAPYAAPLWRSAIDGRLVVSGHETPSWVASPAEVKTVRFVRDATRYHATLDCEETPRVVFESTEPFTHVACSLTDVKLTRNLTVVGRFDTTEGTVTQRRSFTGLDEARLDDAATIPVSFALDAPATAGEVRVEATAGRDRLQEYGVRAFDRLSDRRYEPRRAVSMTTPSLGGTGDAPPIVVVSVDTLRYDVEGAIDPLLDALGDDAFVPSEPRTQGFWTAPAHGSLFTGVHPGDHGYVGWLDGHRDSVIHPDLITLPEFLSEHYYRCSALVSHTRVLPESGFGRGCHRFRFEDMTDWVGRPVDAGTNVDRIVDWIDADRQAGADRVFYFAHLFDAHFPYVPPLDRYDVSDVDMGAIREYQQTVSDVADDPERGYRTQLRSDLPIDEATVSTLREYYAASVDYVARQVARLVDHLKRVDLFDDAFVVVAGDHGEEFGERGFYLHTSLNDANVRPFVAVKPPADSSLEPRDRVDLVDLLPTVARELGVEPPEQCQGRPWHDDPPTGPRIVERIFPDCYNVAVEDDGIKAIFTFEGRFPKRPSLDQLADGPLAEEFYRLSAVRGDGDPDADPSSELRATLLETARAFARRTPVVERTETSAGVQPTQETETRLRHLGYR
ncbi:sulfatase-like hydrolase/transferase [Halomarina rubra]|uniref:Sulfatase-like hydrolase/transferase n=1 Tax=Halomarina rubra TaxID=2071873 RepID=A0ABD6AY93_9EURY|nr:sulfatase-like hydrolase/transferase [Halomarina rubra]